MWEPSHEWRLAEATPSSRGLQWFTRKPLGYSVEPQNRGRRLDEELWPPRPVQPPRRGGQTAWAGQICWRCFEDDFLGSLEGVTYEDLVPLWLVTLPPNLS
jgi:hypothetical protein